MWFCRHYEGPYIWVWCWFCYLSVARYCFCHFHPSHRCFLSWGFFRNTSTSNRNHTLVSHEKKAITKEGLRKSSTFHRHSHSRMSCGISVLSVGILCRCHLFYFFCIFGRSFIITSSKCETSINQIHTQYADTHVWGWGVIFLFYLPFFVFVIVLLRILLLSQGLNFLLLIITQAFKIQNFIMGSTY